MNNNLCIQIVCKNVKDNVNSLLEFAPENDGHEFNQLYTHLFKLRNHYLDNPDNWYLALKSYLAKKNTENLFKSNDLNDKFNTLKVFEKVINLIWSNHTNTTNNDKNKELEETQDNLEHIYIDYLDDIFNKHDNIAESFVKYLCNIENNKLRLIETSKVY